MAISYFRVAEEIFKVLKSLQDRTIVMYDKHGSGPVASPSNAKWIYIKPDNILISLPIDEYSMNDEIAIYRTTGKADNDFRDILNRIRKVTRRHQIGITLRNYEQSVANNEIMSTINRELEELEETEKQSKNKYLVEFRQLLKSYTKLI